MANRNGTQDPWQEQAQWDHVFDGEMKAQQPLFGNGLSYGFRFVTYL